MVLTHTSVPPPVRVALFWKFFAFAATMLVGHLLAQFGAVVLKMVTGVSPTLWHSILMVGVVLLVSAKFLHVFERHSLASLGLGFDRPWIRQLCSGMAAGMVMVALAWGGLVFTGHASWRINEQFSQHIPQFLMAATFSFAVAIHEEVLCRGYVFQVLYRWNRAVGIAVPGLYFVLIHAWSPGGKSPWVALNMFLAHLLYVILFLRTRSLWPCIGVHFAWNFVLGFILGMPFSGHSAAGPVLKTVIPPSWAGGNAFGPESGLIVTAVLTVAVFLARQLRHTQQSVSLLIDDERQTSDTSSGACQTASAREVAPEFAPQSERFAALDVLRAIALFGILPINIQGFALHDSAVLNPYSCAWTDPLNVGVWVVTSALFGRKDLMLFAMIFGAGIMMMMDRCAAAGRSALQMQVQRMSALMLIGVVHAYLIWPGDILFTYSICGLLVFACRKWSPRRLLTAGVLLYLVPILLLILAQVIVPHLKPEWRESIWTAYQPSAEKVAEYYEAYRGSWWSQMAMRVPGALMQQTVLLVIAMGWISAGMMLVGMGLYRLGYLSAAVPRTAYTRMLAWTAPLGFLLTAGGYWLNFRQGWRAEFSFFIGRLPGELGAPFLALACVAVAMLIFARRGSNRLRSAFAAVGRLSLTNYLMHSVICTFLFYGTGLGLIGRVNRVWQFVIVLGIWTLQLILSPLWLARFRFGPVEWLWRSMAYVRLQPLRKGHTSAAGLVAGE